jgi:NAD(P)-dependent dehydrogenase (short-subunit alcohol dehydrogenase family)
MDGRTVVITGASSGVGYFAAADLAARGARVVMICRERERGEAARARLSEQSSGPAPELLLADLSAQQDVRRVAGELSENHERIDVLLNNAGGVFSKRELSADGVERTFATNHLGPFLLTNLLLDLLRASPRARVVTVASEIYSRRIDFENLQGERSYQFFKAYQRSKLCNVLFAFELARRLGSSNVTSNVVSPGPSKTGFGNNMTGLPLLFTRVMKATPRFATPESGAKTLVYAAASPELDTITGRFYYKSKELRTKPITHDAAAAERLWQLSSELCAI